MKQQISPMVFVSALVIILVVVGVFAWRVWMAPSSVAAKEAAKTGAVNPREGGGPDAEALRKRDEYNKAHPDAAGSR